MLIKKETADALDALLAEFGSELPCNFVNRILKIANRYLIFTLCNGVLWDNNSYEYHAFETIVYHTQKGRSIEDIKQEITWLRNFCLDVKYIEYRR